MTLYERYITGDNSVTTVYGVFFKGQTFTIGNTGANEEHCIASVKLLLYRTGSPGTLTVSITEVDTEHRPTVVELASGTTDGNLLTTSTAGEWWEISLTPYTLIAGTEYAIVVKLPTGDTSNKVWMRRDTSGAYTGGVQVQSSNSGSSWGVVAAFDFMFEEHGELGQIFIETIDTTDALAKYWQVTKDFSEVLTLSDSIINLGLKLLYYYQPSSTSQFTIGPNEVLEFSGLAYDDTYIRNNVVVVGTGVTASTADSASLTTYGYYSFRYEDASITSSTDAATIAAQILTNYGAPKASGKLKIFGRNSINSRQKFTLNLPLIGINYEQYEVIQYTHEVSNKGFFTEITFGTPMWDITREVSNLVKKVY